MIGSIWNKWDLHIHSPQTHLANEFNSATIDDFVDCLIAKDISLIGLTNYFYFAENELELVRDSIRNKSADITVLGNVEFRINQQNKDGEWINIHCIFAEHIATHQINDALGRMQLFNSGGGLSTYCCESSINGSSLSVDHITVEVNTLLNHLNDSFHFGEDYLIAVCPNGYGGFRPDMTSGRSLGVALEIEDKGQVILGRPEDRDFFLNEKRSENAIQKPVFVSSDAHKLEDVGGMYSWVKAKPTFEGLRQAIIEPKLRVQQSDDYIEREYIKPYFDRINFNGTVFENQEIEFKNQSIPLNPNLVTIIGGRGTGKSLFLDAMHTKFPSNTNTCAARSLNSNSIDISLNKGDGTTQIFEDGVDNYSYLHVSQGDIQSFTQKPDNLSKEIKTMLRIHENEFDYIKNVEQLDLLEKYRRFVDYWQQKDDFGNAINTPQYQEGIIFRNEQLIATLTTPQNKKLIESYQENLNKVNLLNKTIEGLTLLQAGLTRQISEINLNIKNLNQNQEIQNIPVIETQVVQDSILLNLQTLNDARNRYETENQEIIGDFREQGFTQDISSLLSKVSDYQLAIDKAKSKLQEIQNEENLYRNYVVKRSEIGNEYFDYLEEQKKIIDDSFSVLKENKAEWTSKQNQIVQEILQDIEIHGTLVFDKAKFYSGIEERINRGKFRATSDKSTYDRLVETFNVNDIESLLRLINNENIIDCNAGELINIESFLWKSEFFNSGGRFELLYYLFSPEQISTYLYVNAEFEYKGKTVEKLSVGQRGTFYVSLKLATDPFGSPFVFDQPEDDLDNEFIMKQLVPLFRKIKSYRQVIIVTHNANLVVNTDAEQVIVATNEGEIISYDAGALEDGSVINGRGIRSNVCNILEGGSLAFETRERKYGIQRLI